MPSRPLCLLLGLVMVTSACTGRVAATATSGDGAASQASQAPRAGVTHDSSPAAAATTPPPTDSATSEGADGPVLVIPAADALLLLARMGEEATIATGPVRRAVADSTGGIVFQSDVIKRLERSSAKPQTVLRPAAADASLDLLDVVDIDGGTRILYVRHRANGSGWAVEAADLSGGNRQVLVGGNDGSAFHHASVGGGRIVVTRRSGGDSSACSWLEVRGIGDDNDGAVNPLPRSDCPREPVRWATLSPDGTAVAYVARADGALHAVVADLRSGTETLRYEIPEANGLDFDGDVVLVTQPQRVTLIPVDGIVAEYAVDNVAGDDPVGVATLSPLALPLAAYVDNLADSSSGTTSEEASPSAPSDDGPAAADSSDVPLPDDGAVTPTEDQSGEEQTEQPSPHEDVTDNGDVDESDVEIESESEDRTYGDQRDTGSNTHDSSSGEASGQSMRLSQQTIPDTACGHLGELRGHGDAVVPAATNSSIVRCANAVIAPRRTAV
jgi:hypothetical protein